MNNRFVKNNIGLLVVTGVCALLALVGLVFVVIYGLQMHQNITKVKEVSDKIRAVNNKRPRPVEANKKPISEDVAVYENAAKDLQKFFGYPLERAKERFFEVLRLKKSMWIPDGTDENDEVIKRLLQLSGESQLSALDNEKFDRGCVLLSAEALVNKIGELSADDDKAKTIAKLLPGAEKIGDANRFIAAADPERKLEGAAAAAALAKKIKSSAADEETVKRVRELIPDADKLSEAELAKKLAAFTETPQQLRDRILASAALDNILKRSTAAAELAKKFKDAKADSEIVKRIAALIPNADKEKDNLDEAVVARAVAAAELAKNFKSLPANEAVVKLVAELVPDAAKLSETDLAKAIAAAAGIDGELRRLIPDSAPDTLKKLLEIPASFTAEKFLEAFNRIMEGVDPKNYATRRTNFDDFRRDKFENWDEARAAFIAAVENRRDGKNDVAIGPCIVEKLNSETVDEVLLSTLGIPRLFSGDYKYLRQLMDNILRQLDSQITIVGQARGLGIVKAGGGTGEVEGGGDIQSLNPEDYPAIADHLDIISYMLYRVGSSKAVIWDVQIRLKGSSGGSEGMDVNRRFNDSKEQRDGFDIYHYTLEISGSMEQIRNAVKLLDECYAVRRVYIVKNIALYAESNIADSIFTGRRAENRPSTQQNAPVAGEGRRRRPRSGGGNGDEVSDGGVDDSEAKRKEQEKLDREYEERQKKLDPDKRDGYGEPITAARAGNETFRAVIDVEYVVKPSK